MSMDPVKNRREWNTESRVISALNLNDWRKKYER
jgi:hypothetical protein